MIAIILDVVTIVGLIGFILFLQGKYGFDLDRLEERMRKVETQAAHLIRIHSRRPEPTPTPHEAWMQASEGIDREIIRARERNRS